MRVEFNSTRTYLPLKMEQTECFETLAYKIQTPGNHPEESIQYSGHGESLKSRTYHSSGKRYFIFISARAAITSQPSSIMQKWSLELSEIFEKYMLRNPKNILCICAKQYGCN